MRRGNKPNLPLGHWFAIRSNVVPPKIFGKCPVTFLVLTGGKCHCAQVGKSQRLPSILQHTGQPFPPLYKNAESYVVQNVKSVVVKILWFRRSWKRRGQYMSYLSTVWSMWFTGQRWENKSARTGLRLRRSWSQDSSRGKPLLPSRRCKKGGQHHHRVCIGVSAWCSGEARHPQGFTGYRPSWQLREGETPRLRALSVQSHFSTFFPFNFLFFFL